MLCFFPTNSEFLFNFLLFTRRMANFQKCFVTVGTTRFDRLCKFILSPTVLQALNTLGCKEVILQAGKSDVEISKSKKEGINITVYRYKDFILEDILAADLVISHAGAGTCLEVLEAGKPLLVVVNEDLMDNHQLELAEQLQIDGHLYYCTCDTLESSLLDVDFSHLKPFPKPVPSAFVKFLDKTFIVKKAQ